MSKSHHNRSNNKNGITTKKNSTNGNKTTAIRKPSSGGPRKTIRLHRNKTPGTMQKTGFSLMSILLLLGLGGVVLAGGVVVYDTSANNQRWFSTVKGWFSQKEEKTFDRFKVEKSTPPGKAPKDMVWVPGGSFWMGTDDPNHPYCHPIHKVYVDGFMMGKYEVTNAEWEEFVKETKYETIAEQPPDPKFFPQLPAEVVMKHKPFSLIFSPPAFPLRDLSNHNAWWKLLEGASWKEPLGPKSHIKGMEKFPVVHICWLDTQEFLKWKNKKHQFKKGWEYRLPTEAEWEFAARGGKHMWKYIWGQELKPRGEWRGNIWQGRFPNSNTKEDGYVLASPVGHYPPNAFGLHDMAGNVWEWCHDWYLKDYYKDSAKKNPTGPLVGFDPLEPGMPKRVQRGGSFLCDASYCERYLTYARGKGEISSASNHVGFRYVLAPSISARSAP